MSADKLHYLAERFLRYTLVWSKIEIVVFGSMGALLAALSGSFIAWTLIYLLLAFLILIIRVFYRKKLVAKLSTYVLTFLAIFINQLAVEHVWLYSGIILSALLGLFISKVLELASWLTRRKE